VELDVVVVGVVEVVLPEAAWATVAPPIAAAAPSTASALSMRGRILCASFAWWMRSIQCCAGKGALTPD
jgi:hypothetical protein